MNRQAYDQKNGFVQPKGEGRPLAARKWPCRNKGLGCGKLFRSESSAQQHACPLGHCKYKSAAECAQCLNPRLKNKHTCALRKIVKSKHHDRKPFVRSGAPGAAGAAGALLKPRVLCGPNQNRHRPPKDEERVYVPCIRDPACIRPSRHCGHCTVPGKNYKSLQKLGHGDADTGKSTQKKASKATQRKAVQLSPAISMKQKKSEREEVESDEGEVTCPGCRGEHKAHTCNPAEEGEEVLYDALFRDGYGEVIRALSDGLVRLHQLFSPLILRRLHSATTIDASQRH